MRRPGEAGTAATAHMSGSTSSPSGQPSAAPPLISPWLIGVLTALPLLATVGFALGAIGLTLNPPEPGDDLPEGANIAFVFYTALTASVTALGVAIVIGLSRRRRWARVLGVIVLLAASGLILLGIGTGLDSNLVGSLVGGGIALVACLATAALVATGR